MNTGHDEKKSTPRRKVVANKKAFTITVDQGTEIDTADFIEKTMEQARLFYDISPSAKIIFRGDGAIWITQASSYQEKSFFMLDKYHSFHKLCGIFPKFKNPSNQEKYNITTDLFNKGDHVALIDYLKNVDVPEKKKDKLKELIGYFTKNADGIYNQSLIENDIGCHIESDVSHLVKWLLGYGSKAYSKTVFRKLLTFRIARQNGIEIAKIYKDTMKYNLEVKRDFYRQAIWPKKPVKDYNRNVELPLLKTGKNMAAWLKGLVHPEM